MSLGPWRKYKEKIINGVDGRIGYVFRKRIYTDNHKQGHIYLPQRFVGKKCTVVILLDEDRELQEEIIDKNKMRNYNPFK